LKDVLERNRLIAWLLRLLGFRIRAQDAASDTGGEQGPIVELSEDRMTVTLCAKRPAALSIPDVVEAIKALDVQSSLNMRAIGEVLGQARRGEKVGGRVLVRGREPVAGNPGKIWWSVEVDMSIGLEDDVGNVDFRTRGYGSSMVGEDEQVARLELTRQGEEGVNLLGEPVPVDVLKEVTLVAGEGVRQDGYRFFSTRAGRVTLRGDMVYVDPVMEIPGDVDYSTGHIHLRHLGVVVRGSVSPGFEVFTGGPIEIRGSAEESMLASRSDVTVRGGVLHRETGSVRCCGVFMAKHLQQADIHAVGDVVVSAGIINSEIRTTSRVVAAGRAGCIVGGVTTACGGIVVRRLGSSAGVVTTVRVGAHQDALDHLDAETQRLQSERARIELRDPDDYAELAQCDRVLRELEGERSKILVPDAAVRVRVEGTVYPGVRVVISGFVRDVMQKMERVEFKLDTDTETVMVGPLA